MPDYFELQWQDTDGEWIGEARCRRDRFQRNEDGSYLCWEFSSGLWIRCIAHHDGFFEHAAGGGDGPVLHYRLVTLPIHTEPD